MTNVERSVLVTTPAAGGKAVCVGTGTVGASARRAMIVEKDGTSAAPQERTRSRIDRRPAPDSEKQSGHDLRAGRTRLLTLITLIVLPTLALIVQLSRKNSPFVPLHVAEQSLRIPASGDVVLDLASLLRQPAYVYPHVTLQLPLAVHVRAIPCLHRSAPKARCEADHCWVELSDLSRALTDVSIRIDRPGRYELHVERSVAGRLQKDLIVLHAAR